jgi:hypothetical protein
MTTGANVSQALLVLRLLVAAIAGSLVIFAGIAVLLVRSGTTEGMPELIQTLLPILGLVAILELPVYATIRRGILSKARQAWEHESPRDEPAAELLPSYSMLTIIGGALAEGFGLFGTVVFLLTGSWPALAAPAIALVVLAAAFPSRDRLNRFVTAVTQQYR